MTASEARMKWCPAVRFVPATDGHHAFDNRGDPFDPMRVPSCLGSDCMAWRWIAPKYADSARPAHGYCGLAGAPR